MKTQICIVIIIILLYVFSTWNTSANENYLYGFWVADGDDFCEESEIDSMLVFIGEPEPGWFSTTRTCYIIIMNDLCAQGFTLNYSTGWAGIGVGKYRINAKVKFDDEDIWPDKVHIDVDMRDGTMKIHSDGVIYARLNKQHDTTNLARQFEDAELVN